MLPNKLEDFFNPMTYKPAYITPSAYCEAMQLCIMGFLFFYFNGLAFYP